MADVQAFPDDLSEKTSGQRRARAGREVGKGFLVKVSKPSNTQLILNFLLNNYKRIREEKKREEKRREER